jgi:hypothetical protein
VAQIVRAEHRHGGGPAGARDRRPQPVGRYFGKERRLELAIFARR